MNIALKEKKRVASRELICGEALLIAEENGWEKLTVRALSERLGYAPPILYQHFESKEHLLCDIVASGFDRLNASMEKAAEAPGDSGEKLVRVARARFRFAVNHKALHNLMFGAGGPCRRPESAYKQMCRAEAIVTRLLCLTASGGKISDAPDDGRELLINFIALIKGYTYFAAEMPEEAARAAFFQNQNPEDALALAMERFISSIQSINRS